ncbi:hypothetical protein CYY_008033 [Polysphondylium violaceum]|uniref:LIM zinc-binding domain-containing protein n=1 Tax=Polysphondylium violaceum TaxID=133409 RepID=A0A8J4PPI1_9MYCE|nr:hypothetical protein CYY_008033 [Polysphondylium violaceum]
MVNLGGSAEKCTACAKTVYLTEKIVVEDKEDKKTFHKLCLKCTHCKITLTLGTYASMNGVFYCKPHFKQLFATKGNYDEGFGKSKHSEKWTPQANTAPGSFIKVEETKVTSDKKETPSHIANRFGGSAEKCAVCNTTVYLTEKTVIEDKEDKKVLHKNCLKCKHCAITLNLGTYASMNGVFYCKPHFKQLFATKGNYDESFGLNKPTNDKWTPVVNSAPGGSFVPVEKAADNTKNTNQANPDIAKKFTAVGSEKCDACGKSVYLTEKITVEETDSKRVLHKACLKCSKCGVVQTLGTMVSLDGIIYCKPHFKELYATKGNLDEGFGKAKHSDKWENNPFPYLEKDSNYVPSVEKIEAEQSGSNNEDDVKRFQNINVDETAVTKKFEQTNLEQEQEKESEPEPEQQQEEQAVAAQEEKQEEVVAAVEEEEKEKEQEQQEEQQVDKHEVESESKVEESVAAEEEN